AAVLLAADNPRFPPLLGTGGNDGRLDFTNNFMQHLVRLFDMETGKPTSQTAEYLEGALFAKAVPGMLSWAIGQFSPGSAGGANQGSGFSGGASVNPWDFVLMLEGAALFAATVTRRLETEHGSLSFPFTVRTTGAGFGGTATKDEGSARAEMWLPLWSEPTGLDELKALLAEGRVTLGRRPARDGLDFVRAVSHLGVERGIGEFQRYAFLMRSGKAYLATPLNRVHVNRNPLGDPVADPEFDSWLNRFRRLGRSVNATNRLQSLVRRLEDAIFNFMLERKYPARRLQRVLELLGEAQLYLGRSPKAREVCPPVPLLTEAWLLNAEDDSPDFGVAAALAGLCCRERQPDGTHLMPMRTHLAPEQSGQRPLWLKEESHQVTWGPGTLDENLLRTLRQRLLDAERLQTGEKPLYSGRTAPLAAVADWLAGHRDDSRIGRLLPGLMLVRQQPNVGERVERTAPLPAAYRLLKPFFCTETQLKRIGLLPPDGTLPIPGELLRLLSTGEIVSAVALGERRLRTSGTSIRFPDIRGAFGDSRRLISALLVPIADFELRGLLPRQTPPENAETAR
ncbi:MAG: type I-U CRISPR-associated protein Csx17, partial [Acidobacteriota bacterium]